MGCKDRCSLSLAKHESVQLEGNWHSKVVLHRPNKQERPHLWTWLVHFLFGRYHFITGVPEGNPATEKLVLVSGRTKALLLVSLWTEGRSETSCESLQLLLKKMVLKSSRDHKGCCALCSTGHCCWTCTGHQLMSSNFIRIIQTFWYCWRITT